ncbi:MAG: DNA polymerase III subunit beta [Myxococcales bacterium]|nr:DNA polymerase III subunit beta [Myxococcales bacterium]
MELTIEVAELAKALQRVQGIVEKKTSMPILANVLLRSSGPSSITVSATDLEIGLSGRYDAVVATEGAMTLGARALYDIVRQLPGDQVTLHQAANQYVEIRCGSVQYRVLGLSADSYPSLPTFDEVPFFPIDGLMFRDMIEKTLYAVSTDDTRYNLTGVYCEPRPGPGLRMVATDGHRLAIVDRPMDEAPRMDEGVIIPRKGLQELKKILDDGEAEARLGFIENSAVLEKGNVLLTMRLVDARFPDYQQVIPQAHTQRVRTPKKPLVQALRRTSLLAPDKAQGIRLEAKDDRLVLSAHDPDLGEAREELDVDLDGEGIKIGFNFRYLLDVLSAITEEEVDLEFNDDLSPGVIRGVGSEDYRAVVMPMRI